MKKLTQKQKHLYKNYKVTKLPSAGPKEGQHIDAYLYGKEKGYQEKIDNPKTKFAPQNKFISKEESLKRKQWREK